MHNAPRPTRSEYDFDKSAEAFDISAEILTRRFDEQKLGRTPPVDTTLMVP
jgi:hypothetical protein